ncbi:uncharacterized protein LOC111832370 [Capsella rubella]|uniref:uncharacterized protein LOC111832370 n=1 Tax=Capsella rubella TaxID=81985 RepID=UPI000CD5C2AF|nr:uncharacterized protein LOC111832370 [Capsella rubella]
MYKIVVCILSLSFILFSGSLNTVLARVQYRSHSPRNEIENGVWDQKVFNEIKIAAGGSNSNHAPGCAHSCVPKPSK